MNAQVNDAEVQKDSQPRVAGRIIGGLIFTDFFALVLAMMVQELGVAFLVAGSILVPWLHLRGVVKRPWLGTVVAVVVHGVVLFAGLLAFVMILWTQMGGL